MSKFRVRDKYLNTIGKNREKEERRRLTKKKCTGHERISLKGRRGVTRGGRSEERVLEGCWANTCVSNGSSVVEMGKEIVM